MRDFEIKLRFLYDCDYIRILGILYNIDVIIGK